MSAAKIVQDIAAKYVSPHGNRDALVADLHAYAEAVRQEAATSRDEFALPTGVRVTFTAFVTSDSAGVESTLALKYAPAIPADVAAACEGLIKHSLQQLNALTGADDFRLMTDEEIAAYLNSGEDDDTGDED